MASTLTTFDAFLKERYTSDKVENLLQCGKPFFTDVSKSEDGSGDVLVVPLHYGNPQGVAASTLAQAQAVNSTGANVKGAKWSIEWGDYFGTVDIGDKVMRAARNNVGAFLENKTMEIDGLYETMATSLATYLTKNGGGAIGQRASISSNTITLSEKADTWNFEIGMGVHASANDGSDAAHALRAGTGTYVTAVDHAAGTVTVADQSQITSFANNDYLFRLGDFAGNTSTKLMKGLEAFVTTSTTPPTLWGISDTTRLTHLQRFSGCKVASGDLTGKGLEERIQLLGAYMASRYKVPMGNLRAYMNPEEFHRLQLSLQSRGQRTLTDDSTSFGYEYVEVVSGGRKVRVYADPFFSKGKVFLVRMENVKLWSLGKLVAPQNGDGLEMLRKSTTTDYEYRLLSYPAFACNAPGYCGVVATP